MNAVKNAPRHCPCGKNKPLAQCCGLYISGKQTPKTPTALMRSRYSAYTLGGYGDYLLHTWHPITARGLTAEQLSEKSRTWHKLEVLASSQNGDEGTVEFKAYYSDTPTDAATKTEQVLHEISEFKRVSGKWLYVGGSIT